MLYKLFFASLLCLNTLSAGYPGDSDMSCRICFIDKTDSNAPWARCWNVAADLSSMLDIGLKTSPNPFLHSLSKENIRLELLDYHTSPIEIEPKSALFPADSYRCPTRLRIKARLKIVSCNGTIIHDETITSDHVLDDDGKHYDYCRYNNQSLKYPCTPLAHAHGDFIRDLLARLDRLQQRGML